MLKSSFGLCLLLLATGCDKQTVACRTEDAQDPVLAIAREQVEKAASTQVRGESGNRPVSLSKIRAAVGQLGFSMADIRTSKEDPNSTKRFCVGTLKIRFPANALEDADQARESAGLPLVSDLADDGGIDRNADVFDAEIEFNVQPTDQGDKVFAKTESGQNLFRFAGEVLASSLLKASIAEAQRETRLAQQQAAASEAAAQQESQSATLDLAKNENQLATQQINALWGSIPNRTRAQLQPLQRAWVRKKEADCRLEAAGASLDPDEVETARLGCDTRFTQERARWLEPYRNYEPPSEPESSTSGGEDTEPVDFI